MKKPNVKRSHNIKKTKRGALHMHGYAGDKLKRMAEEGRLAVCNR